MPASAASTLPARADQLAQESGSSRRTLFRNLDRIRRVLFDCVSRRAASAGCG